MTSTAAYVTACIVTLAAIVALVYLAIFVINALRVTFIRSLQMVLDHRLERERREGR